MHREGDEVGACSKGGDSGIRSRPLSSYVCRWSLLKAEGHSSGSGLRTQNGKDRSPGRRGRFTHGLGVTLTVSSCN